MENNNSTTITKFDADMALTLLAKPFDGSNANLSARCAARMTLRAAAKQHIDFANKNPESLVADTCRNQAAKYTFAVLASKEA